MATMTANQNPTRKTAETRQGLGVIVLVLGLLLLGRLPV